MALISLAEWIDRYGDEPDDPDAVANEVRTVQIEAPQRPVAPRAVDYRINTLRPTGSEIAATRTRLL